MSDKSIINAIKKTLPGTVRILKENDSEIILLQQAEKLKNCLIASGFVCVVAGMSGQYIVTRSGERGDSARMLNNTFFKITKVVSRVSKIV